MRHRPLMMSGSGVESPNGADYWRRGAVFSACRTWRYSLWRRWDQSPQCQMVAFIGLNPSTADETADDPTIRRCIGFAKSFGFGGLYMLNAYAFRATDPNVMQAAADAVGSDNDRYLNLCSGVSQLVIACWGVHCTAEREREVFSVVGKTLWCLGVTKAGRPRHPLYLRSDVKPVVLWTPLGSVG